MHGLDTAYVSSRVVSRCDDPNGILAYLCTGLNCVAECTIDNCWYRAEILDVRRADDFLEMTLIFVDYGSTDYISDAAKYVDVYHSGFSLVRTDPGKV